MRTTNLADLKANLKGYVDSVIDDCDAVIINRSNGRGAVLISLDEYNSLTETEYIRSSPQTAQEILSAKKDIENGKGIAMDLDELCK